MDIRTLFEDRVRNSLISFGLDFSSRANVGAAVSGGADSIAMLTALVHVLPENITLKVITVNHNIREASETEGDALFVQDYCRKLGVQCARHDIPRGKVESLAEEKDSGTEDAARRLRYEAFETFIRCSNLDFLCLAHNYNDQLETVLMRFLSGGDCSALSGIPPVRDKFVRPILSLTRAEVEEYLSVQGIAYRTDSTNFDTSYARNCIRSRIMPMLNKEVPGWQTAVGALSKKMREDSLALEDATDEALDRIAWSESEGEVSFDRYFFSILSDALRRRILYRAISAVGSDSRFPYSVVESVSRKSKNPSRWSEEAVGLTIFCRDARIFVQKQKKAATENGFFVIIEESGEYLAGDWKVKVAVQGNKTVLLAKRADVKASLVLDDLGFPFAFRSRQPGDKIRAADGSFKTVSKVFEDWKCAECKDEIPLVQELRSPGQHLVCVWGSALGFKDWIVRD